MAKKVNGPQPPNQQKPYFPKRSNVAKSRYLAKDDLADKQEPRVSVLSFSEETMQMTGETKVAMHFVELSKPLILNAVNYDLCAEAWGDNTQDWIGQQAILYFDPSIMFGRERKGGLRLRPLTRKKKAEAAPTLLAGATSKEVFEDEIPFGKT